ncbi:TIR domain-containing protein [Pectobacterium polaris]|uniref:TIR domain-containing protein n=1 Tax=Pectobacterium polaris TaxID=2042057 RepID=UPI0015814C2C|nr:nucleotide-binding protein [Pectobacterium polaris]
MDSEDEMIENIGAFMALCSTFCTNGASTPDSYKFEYQRLRQILMGADGLRLPLWIKSSATPATVLAHVKMEKGSGNGTWALRRDYFHQEKMKLQESLFATEASIAFSNKEERPVRRARTPVLAVATVAPQTEVSVPPMTFRTDRKKVFIVHGHDGQLKYEVARLVDELGFESIIFHEQSNNGRSIFQKLIELTATVDYAVVLYTACDTGKAAGSSQERPRARQNVVFEHGYLLASLGADKVTAIKDADVEKPSDLDGVLYISVDDNWKYQLARELKSL